jgi:hypothetical protein
VPNKDISNRSILRQFVFVIIGACYDIYHLIFLIVVNCVKQRLIEVKISLLRLTARTFFFLKKEKEAKCVTK